MLHSYLCPCLLHGQFTDYASKIVNVIHQQANDTVKAVDSLGVSVTSAGILLNVTFPYLTMQKFEVLGSINNEIAQALQVTFAPLVKKEKKEAWEKYSVKNQGWIDVGLALSAGFLHNDHIDGGNHTNFVRAPISPNIYRFRNYTEGEKVAQTEPGVQDGPGNYAPVWLQSPAPHDTSIINFDLLSHPIISRHYHQMWDTTAIAVSEIVNLDFLTSGAIIEDRLTHPCTFVMQPVFPSFELQGKEDVVGFLLLVVDWNQYFTEMFVQDNRQITIYTHNSCGGRSFTFLIDGPSATYLGEGDLHDSKYNTLGFSDSFSPLHKEASPLDFCVYDLRVYPTAQMEDQYTSNKPWVYAFVVVIAFFFFAMIFIVYDYHVMVRQTKMEATAIRTNAIVSSLFPANVRDRILKNAEEQADRDMMKNGSVSQFPIGSTTAQLKDYIGENKSEEIQAYGSKPIADLFPSATVMVRSDMYDLRTFYTWLC